MDETQPLLRDDAVEAARRVEAGARLDIVEFDPHGDAENPQDWSGRYKWSMVALLAFMAFTVTFTCISMVPVAGRVVADLGDPSKAAAVLLVTIWELGESAGPLVIAPLSEVFGRYPVFNVCNAGFIAATVLAALCGDAPLFVAARALTGLAVASNVLNPAVVGDMFPPDQRGAAMSLIQFAPLTGGAVGPLIAGAVAQSLGWRSVLWMSALLACVCELLFLTCFRETYKVTILRRKAARLRAETGNPSLRTAFDLLGDDPQSLRRIWETMARPVIVFFKTPVLQAMSLFGAIVFSFFYVLSTTMPDILQDQYHLSPAATGLCFITFTIGSMLSMAVCNVFLDRIYIWLRDARGGEGRPEDRLPLVILGGISLPLSVILYGWVAQLQLPLSVFLMSVVLLGFTLGFAFMPLSAYIVDAFGLYSASAMTALIVTRCLMGTFLPLAAAPLIERFGTGLGFSALGALGLGLAPIPVLVFKYGHGWRKQSAFCKGDDS